MKIWVRLPEVKCRLVPVDGNIRGTEWKLFGAAGDAAASAKPMPGAPGTKCTAFLDHFKDKRVLIA